MMRVREVWKAVPLAASGKIVPRGGSLGGFLCTTTGSVQVTAGEGSGGAVIVDTFDVTEGAYYPMPFDCPLGAYAVLTTAAGTFAADAV